MKNGLKNDIFFSVIIPLYNKEKYVCNAISSVFNQTYTNWELIIIDDGSTDCSFSVLQDFFRSNAIAQSYFNSHHILCQQQINLGVSQTRNNGVALSKGQYICFLDADDWWESVFLEEMVSLILKYPDCGMCGSSFFSVRDGRKTVVPSGLPVDFKSGYINYTRVLAQGNCRPICTGSVVISRTAFLKFGGFNFSFKLGEDFDLYYRISLHTKFVFIHKPLFNYNNDVDSSNRAISLRLYDKSENAFWNLNYSEIKTNPEVEYLINYLKLRAFYPYWLSSKYIEDIRMELKRIDLSQYPFKYSLYYLLIPRFFQVIWHRTKLLGVKLKNNINNRLL